VVGLATPPPAREVALRRRDHQPRIGATRWLDGAAAFVM
jgi:hypothetical protein